MGLTQTRGGRLVLPAGGKGSWPEADAQAIPSCRIPFVGLPSSKTTSQSSKPLLNVSLLTWVLPAPASLLPMGFSGALYILYYHSITLHHSKSWLYLSLLQTLSSLRMSHFFQTPRVEHSRHTQHDTVGAQKTTVKLNRSVASPCTVKGQFTVTDASFQ